MSDEVCQERSDGLPLAYSSVRVPSGDSGAQVAVGYRVAVFKWHLIEQSPADVSVRSTTAGDGQDAESREGVIDGTCTRPLADRLQ